MQKVEFSINIEKIELGLGSQSLALGAAARAHLQLQLTRKSQTLSSQTAMSRPGGPNPAWESEFGPIQVTTKLHVTRRGFMEKWFSVTLLRTTPPLTAGKKW